MIKLYSWHNIVKQYVCLFHWTEKQFFSYHRDEQPLAIQKKIAVKDDLLKSLTFSCTHNSKLQKLTQSQNQKFEIWALFYETCYQ